MTISTREEGILRRIAGRCFSNREIRLDGYEYIDCSFYGCRFVYSGRKSFCLTGNMVSSDCIVVFRDNAADTIKALSELYALGDWGRRQVTATLEQIAELGEAAELSVH